MGFATGFANCSLRINIYLMGACAPIFCGMWGLYGKSGLLETESQVYALVNKK